MKSKNILGMKKKLYQTPQMEVVCIESDAMMVLLGSNTAIEPGDSIYIP